jgi:uncharacterized RDD family membrane protein YckC
MPKCPKCQYLSFDSGDRCRNCGYDFSLGSESDRDFDLPIDDEKEPVGPFADFSLTGDPDAPLVPPNPTPRAPLSVRRGAPATGRPARPRRERQEDPEPRLALDTAEVPIVAPMQPQPEPPVDEAPAEPDAPADISIAAAGARLLAGIIDLVVVGSIDVLVIYFTLKICDRSLGELPTIPIAPLLGFLCLVDGGYLSTFVAAGGQTIGKMAAGIRVIPADPAAPPSERVTFGHAIVRAFGYLVSAAPIGLGFVPIFFGDRRALHDRLADTRVVRA